MKRRAAEPNKASHVTRGNVLDDLDFSPAEAAELKIKSAIYAALLQCIREQEFSQKALAARLGVHQPEVSNLMNGKLSKFSIAKLLRFAVTLEMQVQVKLTAPRKAAA